MAKARRSAGKQRVIFWFNVGISGPSPAFNSVGSYIDTRKLIDIGRTWLLIFRWISHGSRTIQDSTCISDSIRKGRSEIDRRRLGGICDDNIWLVLDRNS